MTGDNRPAEMPRMKIGTHPALTVVRLPSGKFAAHSFCKPHLARVVIDQETGDVSLVFPAALVDFVSFERLLEAEARAAGGRLMPSALWAVFQS